MINISSTIPAWGISYTGARSDLVPRRGRHRKDIAARTLARTGLLLVVLASLWPGHTVQAASLSIDSGVVVKFDEGAGFRVRSGMEVGNEVVFTSLYDDSIAGQTGQIPGLAAPGDWLGVAVDSAVAPVDLRLDGLELRYSGGGSHAALEIAENDYLIQMLVVQNSIVGIRATGSSVPMINNASLVDNIIGLETDFGATPIVHGSEIVGNSQYGILNRDALTTVSALENWWGDESGPYQPDTNPGGLGNPVSAGVDFGQVLGGVPLIDCSVEPPNGLYTTGNPSIQLALRCRNAIWVRVSEDPDFDDGAEPYFPFQDPYPFLLSSQAGPRTLHVQYMAETGNTVTVQTLQPIVYTPGAPTVSILAPTQGETILTDTLIRATADDAIGLQSVSFYVNDEQIQILSGTTYEALWQLGTAPDGSYTLRVRALNTAGQHTDAQVTVIVNRQEPDVNGPAISDLRLAGQPLADGATVTSGGLLTFRVEDPSGIGGVQVLLSGQVLPGGLAANQYSAPLTFSDVANGPHVLEITAHDSLNNQSALQRTLDVQLPAPPAPVLIQPMQGSTVQTPQVAVTGSAMPGSQVQLYLNETEYGELLPTTAAGSFSAQVALGSQGQHALSADARNSRGISPRSATTQVEFGVAPPTVLILNPTQGAILSEDIEIAVQASDPLGIARVKILIDNKTVATITDPPPYVWAWDVSDELNGARTVRAEATNTFDVTAFVERNVMIEHPPEEPPPVQTPYTGLIDQVTPQLSYGEQGIVITGRAVVSRDDHTPVPSALVALILKVGNFERRINTTSNADGQFTFTFNPVVTDVGTYQVGARHPDEPQANFNDAEKFTINRLTVRTNHINLRAAYTIPTPVRVELQASAGSGVPGITFALDGTLPNGIQLELPKETIHLSEGERRTIDLEFLASAHDVGERGTINLIVRAADSGLISRGTVKINYELSAPQPVLRPVPASVALGVARTDTVTGSLTLRNVGLATAEGVQVQLRDAVGGLNVPSWINLVSSPAIGSMAVGAEQVVQVTASPQQNIPEGVYHARLQFTANNVSAGYVPVSIAVNEGGHGNARFHVSDIFTYPEGGEWGDPVLGMQNARVRLQKEIIDPSDPTTAQTYTALTDAEGLATLTNLPSGRYRYRVSGSSHVESHGRIHVQPGITVEEAVFLDYDFVSFEWSVTETTIQDHYEVIVEAVYQTQVPAAVVSIRPAAINLPPMQVGEEISGVLTITNLGLIRADNVVFTPPESDEYFEYEFLGEVPTSLAAMERITLPYKVTAISSLPTPGVGAGVAGGLDLASVLTGTESGSGKAGSCGSYRRVAQLGYGYQCINGAWRYGAASSSYGRMYGTGCGSSGSITHYGCQGCTTGPWPGGNGGPLYSIPMFSSPGCTPDCNSATCQCQPPGGGGG